MMAGSARIKPRTGLPERGRQDKGLRQRALIEAATAVFAEHGYEAATTREVAERAGCAEGLIHRYFGGKRGLLLAIYGGKIPEMADALRSALPDRDTVEEEIESILLWDLGGMWEHRDFMRVGISQAIIDPELGRTIRDGIHQTRVDLIAEKLRRHRSAGRVRPDADLEAVAQAIVALGFSAGFLAQVVFEMSSDNARRIVSEVTKVLARGIARERAG